LNGYELFEDNVIDFRYLLFYVNRMDKEELIEIANVISSIFLLDQNVEVYEIINRLKIIGKIVKKGYSTNIIIEILEVSLDEIEKVKNELIH
jgi:hypothetical protein